MKVLTQIFAWLVVLALAAGVIYVIIEAPGWFASFPKATQAAVGGIGAAVLVPTIAYFSTRALDRARLRDEAIRPQKTALYADAIKGFMNVINAGTLDSKETEERMKTFTEDITPRLITYGDRKVVKAWVSLLQDARHNELNSEKVNLLFSLENLMVAIRKDLGLRVQGHEQGDLLGVFITDIDSVLPKKGGLPMNQLDPPKSEASQ